MTSAKVSFCTTGIFLPEIFLPPNTHDFCLTVIPEASIEALKEQLAAAQRTTFPLSCWLAFLFILIVQLC
jgi:hypothetical protein